MIIVIHIDENYEEKNEHVAVIPDELNATPLLRCNNNSHADAKKNVIDRDISGCENDSHSEITNATFSPRRKQGIRKQKE